jgi:hypothetical protein
VSGFSRTFGFRRSTFEVAVSWPRHTINEHTRCVRPAASRRCTPEISLCSCPFETAASSTRSQRPQPRHAPSRLIRPPWIAGDELASENRFVRFQATHVGVRAGRRSAEHNGNAHLAVRLPRIITAITMSSPDAGCGRVRQGRSHGAAGKRPQRFLASTCVLAFSLCELAGASSDVVEGMRMRVMRCLTGFRLGFSTTNRKT